MRPLMPFLGILDPQTKKATAFYAALAVVLHQVWKSGLEKWSFALLVLLAGLGGLSGLAQLLHGGSDPPPGK